MGKFLNKTVLAAFGCIAIAKGYSFKKAESKKEQEEASQIYNEEAFSFPEDLEKDIQRFKAGTLNFIAYHKGIPVGMVRMANPKIINRAYEHYGVDKEGNHHEIQSLVVKKGYRDGAQFVMLGLVKELYAYSIKNSISTWSACGKRNVYLTMRKYCKNITVVDVDFKNVDHPVTHYLYANNIVETYFIMDVTAFVPWQILKKCVRKLLKRLDITGYIKNNVLRQPVPQNHSEKIIY